MSGFMGLGFRRLLGVWDLGQNMKLQKLLVPSQGLPGLKMIVVLQGFRA